MTSAAFQFQYCGDCLGDLVPNGTTLTAVSGADLEIMDVVAVILNPDDDGPFAAFLNGIAGNGFIGVTKLYLGQHENGRGETIYRLGQINPPLVTPVPASAIETIAKVIDGDVDRLSPSPSSADMAALELLFPFTTGEETKQ